MGCLCSSKLTLQGKAVKRTMSFPSTMDQTEFSGCNSASIRSFHSEYKLQPSSIGSGLLGEIKLCTHKISLKTYAVKIISKSNLTPDQLKSKTIESQVHIMQSIDHPTILKTYDFFEDLNNFYLIMDYINGGDLFTKMEQYGRFSEKTASKIMKQLLLALSHLHSKNIVHRDIKCENLLVEEKSGHFAVKLIDFDTITKLAEGKKLEGIQGTVYYMAPEVVSGFYNEKCDIWSAGIVLYSLITQNFPFGGSNDDEIMRNIRTREVNLDIVKESKASKELLEFIEKLLSKAQDTRPSARQALEHPWILKHNKVGKIKKTLNIHYEHFWGYLKYALKMWAIKNIVHSREIVDWHLIFVNLDKNFDGVICREELSSAIENEELLDKVMELADWNGNGVLEYYEFLSIFVQGSTLLKYSDEIIQELDKDNSGQVSLRSLVSYLEYSLEGVFARDNLIEQFHSLDLANSEILDLLND